MVLFSQLRISDDGSKMYINAHVNGAEYFKDVYIESITIMTSEKISETDPRVPTSDYIYTQSMVPNTKEINLVLKPSDFLKIWEEDSNSMAFKRNDMSNTLFFVYIKCTGIPSSDTPCTLDKEWTMGVVFDETMLYQRVMNFTKALQDNCSVPIGFVDFILLWNAFKASVETEHFISAIKFFNMLFDIADNKDLKSMKGCGCYG